MQVIELYVGTDLRGPAKGEGRTIYILRTTLKNGKPYESQPEAAAFENATESRLVLYAIRDALQRMNYACEVVVYTECSAVAAAINQHWPETWQENGWRNAKGKDAKDADLWGQILRSLEESGHLLRAESGKHEWSGWMHWKLPLTSPLLNTFKKLQKEPQN